MTLPTRYTVIFVDQDAGDVSVIRRDDINVEASGHLLDYEAAEKLREVVADLNGDD